MSLLGSILSYTMGGTKKMGDLPATPTYYTDPNFSGTQDFLRSYSEQGLQGNMPDWYKQIGEAMPADLINGKTNSLNAGILGGAAENAAIRGTGRGGALSADTMNALGNADANLRYSDWERAMTGRQNLMNTFLGTETGVRNAAYSNMGAKNTFDQWGYNQDLDKELLLQQRRDQMQKEKAQAIGGIFGGSGDISSLFGGSSTGGGSGSTSLESMLGLSSATDDLGYSNPDTGSKVLNFGKTSSGGTDWMSMIMKFLPMMLA
jgi:hypothetical protein